MLHDKKVPKETCPRWRHPDGCAAPALHPSGCLPRRASLAPDYPTGRLLNSPSAQTTKPDFPGRTVLHSADPRGSIGGILIGLRRRCGVENKSAVTLLSIINFLKASAMDLNAKDQALDRLDHLLEAHRAAVESIRIASCSDGFSDQLTVAMQTYYEFSPGKYEECKSRVLNTIQRAKRLVTDDFLYQRSMLLVALCSLLDVTVKDVVAEHLTHNCSLFSGLPPELRNELEKNKSQSTFSSPIVEDAFSIVDSHFKRGNKLKKLNHAERYRYWLSLVLEEPMPDGNVDSIINQAFQVRNLAIHRSESASAALAQENSRFWNESQQTIRLGSEEINDIAKAFEHFLHGIGTANL